MTWRQVFVDANGQAGPGSMNAAGQVAYTASTADGPRARFFDGLVVREVVTGPAHAVAVNTSGQVAGHRLEPDGSTRAFRWTPGGADAIVLLDTGPGLSTVSRSVNTAGQIAGNITQARLAFPQAFRWTSGSVPQPLESAGSFGIPMSEGHWINAAGTVGGLSSTDAGTSAHAALWVPGQPVRDLGTLGGLGSRPAALNDAGQVAGQAQTATGAQHAFVWTPATGMRDLGTLGGAASAATALNEDGWVAGQADTADFASQAFVWRDGVMTALGTLGGRTSAATAINRAGWVGGTAQTADASMHAMIWTAEHGMLDLNTRATLAQPAVLQSVIALADDGSVLVTSSVGLLLLRP